MAPTPRMTMIKVVAIMLIVTGVILLLTALLRLGDRRMQDLGVPAIRFNFRGVGASEGGYADGDGELEDLRWVDLAKVKELPLASITALVLQVLAQRLRGQDPEQESTALFRSLRGSELVEH